MRRRLEICMPQMVRGQCAARGNASRWVVTKRQAEQVTVGLRRKRVPGCVTWAWCVSVSAAVRVVPANSMMHEVWRVWAGGHGNDREPSTVDGNERATCECCEATEHRCF